MKLNRIAVGLMAAASVLVAQSTEGTVVGTPYLTEIFTNPTSGDNGFEGFEIAGPPGLSLAGYKLIIIEGDNVGTLGVVTLSLAFPSVSIGSNGLFVWRDASLVLNSGVPAVHLPGYNPATTVHVADFVPDMQNGSQTYVLGTGTAPAVNVDLDTNNDGVLEPGALAGFTIVDAVGVRDATTDIDYAAAMGFGGILANGNTIGAVYRIPDCSGAPGTWASAFIVASPSGPYILASAFAGFPYDPGVSWSLDLGRRNHCVAALSFVNGGSPGTPLSIDVTGGVPNAVYLTALTFNAGNSPTPPYTGLHAGLVIDLAELDAEYLLFTPPFVGFLDGSGASSFLVPDMPVLGMTLYGATLMYDPAAGDFVGRTPITSIAL